MSLSENLDKKDNFEKKTWKFNARNLDQIKMKINLYCVPTKNVHVCALKTGVSKLVHVVVEWPLTLKFVPLIDRFSPLKL